MQKPKITFIAPSHRTWLWKPFVESIITHLDWEVIFVSDIHPKEGELPNDKHFRYIYSPVKPAQCFEIAYRASDGTHIVWTGDDFVYAPYALDNAFAMHRSFHDHKVMVSFDVYEDGEEATKRCHKIPWDEKIQLTTTAIISKEAIHEVGGLADVNFVSGHWDVDLQMRIYKNGGRLFVCPNAIAYEPHCQFHKVEANFALNWAEELEYFTELWKNENGNTRETRKYPFVGYSNKNLHIESQGKKGKWI